jgi:hypothetical protein
MKPPVPTMRGTVSLIKVKLCNSLLRMPFVCIRSYLKSVLRHTFLILDTYIRKLNIYVSKDVRIRGYFSKPKGVQKGEKFWGTLYSTKISLCVTIDKPIIFFN